MVGVTKCIVGMTKSFWYYWSMKLLSLENPFGASVYHEENVSSTMDLARVLAGQNKSHGTVITADFQEAGRGRLKRSWFMNRGENLMFTILLRYADVESIPKALTLKTGLAVSLAVEDLAPDLLGSVMVKWPNDVMIGSSGEEAARKAAGILTETDGRNVFIGVGVNVLQREFTAEHRWKAVSIIRALDEKRSALPSASGSIQRQIPVLPENARFILLEKILLRLYEEIEKPPDGNASGIFHGSKQNTADWRERLLKRLYKKDRMIAFAQGPADSENLVEGILKGIGPGGELLIIPKGEKKERAFVTGELRIAKQ